MKDKASKKKSTGSHQKSQMRPSWILGSIFGLFLVAVYVFEGRSVSPEQHKLLGLFGAFTAGSFSYFFSGDIGLKLHSSVKGWFGISLKATGGIAVFVFVLYWWNGPSAPITTHVTFIHQEVKNFISDLDTEFQKFESKLNDGVGGSRGDLAVLLAKEQSLLAASKSARNRIEQFLQDHDPNRSERDLLLAAMNKYDEYARAREGEIVSLQRQRSLDMFARVNDGTNAVEVPNPTNKVTNDPTEEALNKLGFSLTNTATFVLNIDDFLVDGFFPQSINIFCTPRNASIAVNFKNKLLKLNAQQVVIYTNANLPTLSGKITYQPEVYDLNFAENIHNVLNSVDRDLGGRMQVVNRSELGSDVEKGEVATTINVYLP